MEIGEVLCWMVENCHCSSLLQSFFFFFSWNLSFILSVILFYPLVIYVYD